MIAILAAMLLTSGMTPVVDASRTVAATAEPRCLGAYGTASLGLHQPRGSWYDADFKAGPGILLAIGHRPHRLVAVDGSWYYGLSDSKPNTDLVSFQLATINARLFTPSRRNVEWFVEAGVSPSARMAISNLENRGYATHAGAGLQLGAGRVRATAGARWNFVRYTRGELSGSGGSLGRQRHGDLLVMSVGITLAP